MEHIIRDNDNDLIESSIIESQKHHDLISQYRREKKARSLLQEWKHFTKSQLSRRQFVLDACNDLRSHNLKSNTFKPWKDI